VVTGIGLWQQGLGTETLLTSIVGMVMIVLRIVTKAPLE
jgi:hypothetical protein